MANFATAIGAGCAGVTAAGDAPSTTTLANARTASAFSSTSRIAADDSLAVPTATATAAFAATPIAAFAVTPIAAPAVLADAVATSSTAATAAHVATITANAATVTARSTARHDKSPWRQLLRWASRVWCARH